MHFDGTKNLALLTPNSAQKLKYVFSGDFTIEWWVKFPGPNQNAAFGFHNHCTGVYAQESGWFLYNTGALVRLAATGVETLIRTIADPTLNEYHHLALVRSGSQMRYYLDGIGGPIVSGLSGVTSNPINPPYGGKTGIHLACAPYNWTQPVPPFGKMFLFSVRIITQALYLDNFIPISSAFAPLPGTTLLLNFANNQINTNASILP